MSFLADDGLLGVLPAQHHDQNLGTLAPPTRRLNVRKIRVLGKSPNDQGNQFQMPTLGYDQGGFVGLCNYTPIPTGTATGGGTTGSTPPAQYQRNAALWFYSAPGRVENAPPDAWRTYQSKVVGPLVSVPVTFVPAIRQNPGTIQQTQGQPGTTAWIDDKSIISQPMAMPMAAFYPTGFPGFASSFSGIDDQQVAFNPAGGILVSVTGGTPKGPAVLTNPSASIGGWFSSRVYDTKQDGTMDDLRWARLHSMFYIFAGPLAPQPVDFKNQPGAGSSVAAQSAPAQIAWNLGPDARAQDGHGAIADLPTYPSYVGDDRPKPPIVATTTSPPAGSAPGGAPLTVAQQRQATLNAYIAASAATTPPLTAAQAQAAAVPGSFHLIAGGGFSYVDAKTGQLKTSGSGSLPTSGLAPVTAQSPGAPPATATLARVPTAPAPVPPTKTAPVLNGGFPSILAATSWRAGGMFDPGMVNDPHQVAVTPDAQQINAAALRYSTINGNGGTLWRGPAGCAPMEFNAQPYDTKAEDGPYSFRVWLRNDVTVSHSGPYGTVKGLFRWQTTGYHQAVTSDPGAGPTGSTASGATASGSDSASVGAAGSAPGSSGSPGSGPGSGGPGSGGPGGPITGTVVVPRPATVPRNAGYVQTPFEQAVPALLGLVVPYTPGVENFTQQPGALTDGASATMEASAIGPRLEAYGGQAGFSAPVLNTPANGQGYVGGNLAKSGFALTPPGYSVRNAILGLPQVPVPGTVAHLMVPGAVVGWGDPLEDGGIANGVVLERTADGVLTASVTDAAGGTTSSGQIWPSESGDTCVFGDGSDGLVDLNGTNTFAGFASTTGVAPNLVYTLTRDLYAETLTVEPGKILNTAGFRVFGRTSVVNKGTIQNNGFDGSAGGAGAPVGTLGGGGKGGVGGGTTAGTATANSYGGSGGNANAGAGTGGGAAAVPGATVQSIHSFPPCIQGSSTGTVLGGFGVRSFDGGAGGGSANVGGNGGGGGGGGVVVASPSVDNSAGTIQANGGSATTGGTNGGGGGGGWVNVATPVVPGGTIQANGGSGHGTGSSGSTGSVFNIAP